MYKIIGSMSDRCVMVSIMRDSRGFSVFFGLLSFRCDMALRILFVAVSVLAFASLSLALNDKVASTKTVVFLPLDDRFTTRFVTRDFPCCVPVPIFLERCRA
jgi:hypothetical protein